MHAPHCDDKLGVLQRRTYSLPPALIMQATDTSRSAVSNTANASAAAARSAEEQASNALSVSDGTTGRAQSPPLHPARTPEGTVAPKDDFDRWRQSAVRPASASPGVAQGYSLVHSFAPLRIGKQQSRLTSPCAPVCPAAAQQGHSALAGRTRDVSALRLE
eukprot:5004273-Prymnesium_polylepis.1